MCHFVHHWSHMKWPKCKILSLEPFRIDITESALSITKLDERPPHWKWAMIYYQKQFLKIALNRWPAENTARKKYHFPITAKKKTISHTSLYSRLTRPWGSTVKTAVSLRMWQLDSRLTDYIKFNTGHFHEKLSVLFNPSFSARDFTDHFT